jgi:hemoglobin
MSTDSEPGPPASALPLTASPLATPSLANDVSEDDIRRLVDAFYSAVRDDGLIGPVFAERVRDWSVHLPKMYSFWSSVVRRTGRYAGRPFEAHQQIDGLSGPHFERWLALWEVTVERELAARPPAVREAFRIAAQRMAASLSGRLTERAAP